MRDLNVNVFVHGLALCVPGKSIVDVLIPNMGSDHTYKAGSFLGEYQLKSRPMSLPYFLTGVEPGNGSFDQRENGCLYADSFDVRASAEDLWARLTLPQPAEILSLRRYQEPLEMDIDPNGILAGQRPATVQVLRYHAPSIDDVSLEPHDAPLGVHTVDGRRYLNLHITSEGDALVETRQHNMEGFHRVLNLIPQLRGTPVHIHPRHRVEVEPETRDWLDHGFAAVELGSQQDRTSLLVQKGMAWRCGEPEPVATFANGDPAGCGVLVLLLGLLLGR